MIMLTPEIDLQIHAGPQLLYRVGLTLEQFQLKVQPQARSICDLLPEGELWGTFVDSPHYRVYAVYRGGVHALYGTRADYVEFLDGKCTWCDQIDRAEKAGIDPVSLTCDWL